MIQKHLQQFQLPIEAIQWLGMLYGAIQVFDDVADGDKVDRADLDGAIFNTLVSMPSNPFFLTHLSALAPAVATMIFKWQASDKMEREGKADEKSYMLRAGYFDVVLLVISLIHGPVFATQNASHVYSVYGETCEDYLKEFYHA